MSKIGSWIFGTQQHLPWMYSHECTTYALEHNSIVEKKIQLHYCVSNSPHVTPQWSSFSFLGWNYSHYNLHTQLE